MKSSKGLCSYRRKDLAPAGLVAGTGFRVDSPVQTDGLVALFVIRSNVGNFNAPGLEPRSVITRIAATVSAS